MKQTIAEIKVEMNDVITPLSCSSMIIEFIKYIIYQKQLIPYPYDRLKMYVCERKKQLSAFETKNAVLEEKVQDPKESLASRKYFKKTATAHDSLENMFKVITDELTNFNYDHLEEVVLLLGTSFTNPQDIFRICIPRLNYSNSMKYQSTRKNWRNLFRTIINSEKFNDIVCGDRCTGSMRILLKMKPTDASANTDFFIPRAEFKLPTRGNQAIISFGLSASAECAPEGASNGLCSCGRFLIFQDDQGTPLSRARQCRCQSGLNSSLPSSSDCTSSSTSSLDATCQDLGRWFQIKDTLKYFADVTVNDRSLTDLWMNPKLTLK